MWSLVQLTNQPQIRFTSQQGYFLLYTVNTLVKKPGTWENSLDLTKTTELNQELIEAVKGAKIHAALKALSAGADPDTSVQEENDTLSVVHLAARANSFSNQVNDFKSQSIDGT